MAKVLGISKQELAAIRRWGRKAEVARRFEQEARRKADREALGYAQWCVKYVADYAPVNDRKAECRAREILTRLIADPDLLY